MICRKELTSFEFSSACSEPVRTCTDGGRIGLISSITLPSLTPGLEATKIRSTRPSLPSRRCASVDGEDGDRGAAQRGDRAELCDAGEREAADRADRRDPDLFADLEALVFGGALVDHDLAVGRRPLTRGQLHRVEAGLLGIEAEAEGRRAAAGDRLAVAADDLGLVGGALEVEDRPGRGGHPGQPADAGGERFGDRHVAGRFADDALAADHGAGPLVGGVEDAIEGARDRVGEDVGAAHHRHAEDDRDRGQDRAAAAEEQPL